MNNIMNYFEFFKVFLEFVFFFVFSMKNVHAQFFITNFLIHPPTSFDREKKKYVSYFSGELTPVDAEILRSKELQVCLLFTFFTEWKLDVNTVYNLFITFRKYKNISLPNRI